VNVVQRCVWSVAIAVLVASAFFTPRLATSSLPVEQVSLASGAMNIDARTAGRAAEVPDEQADEAAGFTDLYGNEVTDAVATYTFDRAGSLYELHSPQTELPRLGIPKS
jgi:hypothetical protein